MKTRAVSLIVLTLVLGPHKCVAKDIYVAQNAAGANSGIDCADALTAAWFNTPTNWGAGGGQLSPGDTAHLCGTFTGTPGQTMLTTRASGTNGNPITIRFENNAILNAPYWSANGAIIVNHNYIIIDGGTNGTIQNTLDGTAGQPCPGGTCAFQQTSVAVQGNGASNFTVRNVIVKNFYIRQEDSTTDNTDVECIMADSGDNVLFQNNTVDHCRVGFGYTNNTASSTHGPGMLANNTLTFVEHGMTIACGAVNAVISSVSVYNNDFGGGAYLWDSGQPNIWHHDPIHMFSQSVGSAVNGAQIYNNYFHGIWSRDSGYGATHITAMIFLEQIGSGSQIFNNVIDLSQGGVLNQSANADVFCKGSGSNNCAVYNNTFVDAGFGTGFSCSANSGHDIRNNIFYNTDGIYAPLGCTVTTADRNSFYLTTGWTNNGATYHTLVLWQSLIGLDINSITTNPNLKLTTYTLPAGSLASGLGVNLTSVGISPLDFDKGGLARPVSGGWDVGAFQIVNPPVGLAVVVQ